MTNRPLSRDIKQRSAVSREPTHIPEIWQKVLPICELIPSSFPRNRRAIVSCRHGDLKGALTALLRRVLINPLACPYAPIGTE
ncbi:hypothetical protein BHE74_00054625 [Ensete ventricosum]|nr:hypothetical protein BHE74_00054625 [Ensete ventricosum]